MLTSIADRIDKLFPRPRVEGRESHQAYSEWEFRTGKALLEKYPEQLGDLGGKRLLDIGCGLGGKTVVYSDAGADVTGVDIDPVHCAGAVAYSLKKGCPAGFICGDAGSLPFPDGSFDLVVANDSMEHFPDPAAALGEIVRVTRKGGRVFLFFTPWGSPLGSHLYDHIRTPWCHLLYSDDMLRRLLEIRFRERGDEDPAGNAAKAIEEYNLENNRISVAGYRRILDSIPGIEVELEELIPPKFGFLRPLTRVPLIGEFFTGTVVSFLRKI